MSRNDPRRPDELVNSSGAAELLGVTRAAVSNYRKRNVKPPFPEPWLEVAAPRAAYRIALFVREEIEAWAADRHAVHAARNARNVERLERQLAAAREQAARLEARP